MEEARYLNLADHYRTFSTRPRGQEMYGHFAELADNTAAKFIVVCWDGVRAASPSFIDEFVGGLAKAAKKPDCPEIVFTGENEYLMNMLDTILRRRELIVHHARCKEEASNGILSTLGGPRELEAATA